MNEEERIKKEMFNEKVRAMPIFKKMKFAKELNALTKRCYSLLCDECKQKMFRAGSGFIEYCPKCKEKTAPELEKVYARYL